MSETVRTRFVNYILSKGITKAEGERMAKLARGSLSQQGEIKPEKIVSIKKAFPELSLMWLMTGEGEQIEQTLPPPAETSTRERAVDRLSQFVRFLKERDVVKGEASFEVMCGLSNKYLSSSRKHSRGAIGSDIIARIYEKFPELNLVWLCTGKGNMIDESKGLNIDYKKAYEGALLQISALNEIISKN